jgi:hypothetical protein
LRGSRKDPTGREVVIIDGVRTPIGRYGGGLSKVHPDDLLASSCQAPIARIGVDTTSIDEAYAGCGNQTGDDISNSIGSMSLTPRTMPKPDKVPVHGHLKMYDTIFGWQFENPRMNALCPIIGLGGTADRKRRVPGRDGFQPGRAYRGDHARDPRLRRRCHPCLGGKKMIQLGG